MLTALRNLLTRVFASPPEACPRCGHDLEADPSAGVMVNPRRKPSGMPEDGAPLRKVGFVCPGCDARLYKVHRSKAEPTWEDRV